LSKTIAKKRFGQHFLIDEAVLDRIIHSLSPREDDRVLEIGPGSGALTDRLVECLDHLTVVELDRDLVGLLKRKYDPEKVTVIQCDILDFHLSDLAPNKQQEKKVRIIGNLPYNISTPLLFNLIDSVPLIKDMVFMVQKEVALRLCARPGNKNYGRLSVMAQLEYKSQMLFDVPPKSFDPPPKVNSSVIRMVPEKVNTPILDFPRFEKIVKSAFSQRRKTLRNSLREWISAEQFETAKIQSSLRAENLDVIEFIRLSNV
jgi:16S rRNA (adenine1518-N6/adenine1519-N6)-dimethyltransferase